jgi:ABC-2 type transport system ATP-binding protein
MRSRRLAAAAGGIALLAVLPTSNAVAAARRAAFTAPAPAVVVSSSPGESGKGFDATLMTWRTAVGPDRGTPCEVAGELFVPARASRAHPVPAILTTNGFGGSYKDQLAFSRYFAARGYAVLTYSGLGFGDSGCDITLDAPEWDGAAASQLI